MGSPKVGLKVDFLKAARDDSKLEVGYFLKLLGKGASCSRFSEKKKFIFFMFYTR
jgi:hypothetical protein